MSRALRWGLSGLVFAAVVATIAVVLVRLAATSSIDVTELEVGDCFVLDPGESGLVGPVDVLECSAPHDAEVVALGDLNPDGDRPYPDDDALFAEAEARCAMVPADSAFAILAIAPTEATWEGRSGRYVCVAVAYGGVMITTSYGAEPASSA